MGKSLHFVVSVREYGVKTYVTETHGGVGDMRIQKGTDAHRLSIAVGQAFARVRREKGMTQSQVAEDAGLQQAFISRFENGRTNPTLKTMSDIAAVFGCKPSITLEPEDNIKKEG